jgi:hypothetical protein
MDKENNYNKDIKWFQTELEELHKSFSRNIEGIDKYSFAERVAIKLEGNEDTIATHIARKEALYEYLKENNYG